MQLEEELAPNKELRSADWLPEKGQGPEISAVGRTPKTRDS